MKGDKVSALKDLDQDRRKKKMRKSQQGIYLKRGLNFMDLMDKCTRLWFFQKTFWRKW